MDRLQRDAGEALALGALAGPAVEDVPLVLVPGVVVVVVVEPVVVADSSRRWQAVSDAAAMTAIRLSWAILGAFMRKFLVERPGEVALAPGRSARRRDGIAGTCRARPLAQASQGQCTALSRGGSSLASRLSELAAFRLASS